MSLSRSQNDKENERRWKEEAELAGLRIRAVKAEAEVARLRAAMSDCPNCRRARLPLPDPQRISTSAKNTEDT